MSEQTELLSITGLVKHFPVSGEAFHKEKKVLHAVDGVSLTLRSGEVFGLVGESGCGKSTLGRTILKLHEPTAGKIVFRGEDITSYNSRKMQSVRKHMQMIFQDPYSALNPRMTIYEAVKAPLDVHNVGSESERDQKVRSILSYVGIGENQIGKYPHELSGGQRQRVVIARAVVLEPEFIVCDEPVSALDVSVRSQVLNLMKDLQQKEHMSYLFISHDLSVVRYLCDRIAVMYLGQIVELADKQQLFDHPCHPYTKALLSAIPVPDVNVKSEKIILQGEVPNPIDPPSGCRFHVRCPYAEEQCCREAPCLTDLGNGHLVSCRRAKEFME